MDEGHRIVGTLEDVVFYESSGRVYFGTVGYRAWSVALCGWRRQCTI